jgi:hypothetical protein
VKYTVIHTVPSAPTTIAKATYLSVAIAAAKAFVEAFPHHEGVHIWEHWTPKGRSTNKAKCVWSQRHQ